MVAEQNRGGIREGASHGWPGRNLHKYAGIRSNEEC